MNGVSNSYEGKMLAKLAMPSQKEIEQALLKQLVRNDGTVKEFGAGQKVVDKLADLFGLNESQRRASLETIYRKENRVKKALLWHRLLFRAADSLAKEGLVSRPTQTAQLTGKREWMLTEKGLDKSLELCNISSERKDSLPTKSFEVQKMVKKLINSAVGGEDYAPFDRSKDLVKITRESV